MTPWGASTIYGFLHDTSVIGVLTLCKRKAILSDEGITIYKPHEGYREIPGGIPAIVPVDLFERAQRKLAANQVEKSKLPKEPEAYLLRGHIYCSTCKRCMVPNTIEKNLNTPIAYYRCNKRQNKYNRCPSFPIIRASLVNEIVWEEMCLLFERLEHLQTKIEQEVKKYLSGLLENTTGQEQLLRKEAELETARTEQMKHPEESYLYGLIGQDIVKKEEELARYKEELGSARNLVQLTALYQQRVLSFLTFLNRMRGRYHKASFQEKRNALEVLGVRVSIDPEPKEEKTPSFAGEELPEWLTPPQAARVLGLTDSGFRWYLEKKAVQVSRKAPRGHMRIRREEIQRLAEERTPHPQMTKEGLRRRVKITYSPLFSTGTQIGVESIHVGG